MSALICPKCGKTSDTVAFIEAFCVECYPVSIKVPDKVEFEQCTRCGRARLKGDWTPYTDKKIGDLVLAKCRGDFESAGYDVERQTAVFTMKHGVKVERLIPLEMKKTICPQCSRISGGYFEAIIQLRGNRAKMEKYALMLISRLEKKTFIAKTEEKDEGLDLYVGNSKAVVALMGNLGVRALITKKLVGRDQGKRLYRTTFMVRL
ncbi:MAG: NMD3-related protein [Candidatus ainarchaeum sp.]|nr:NMD3-related protein [Candidatus ainarchaeum sp.]